MWSGNEEKYLRNKGGNMILILVFLFLIIAGSTSNDSADAFYWFFPIFVGFVGGIIAFFHKENILKKEK